MTEMLMGDYDLSRFSPREFEHFVQALALKLIGPGLRIFGDGPDGAREATYEGPMPTYPVPGDGWNGYLVLQVKHCLRPTGDTGKDGGVGVGGTIQRPRKVLRSKAEAA